MKTPKPKTSLKRSRPKKKRSHLPALSQLTRDMLQMQMEANPVIPRNVSSAVMASFNSAANPDAEKVDVVIETLDAPEKAIVKQSMPAYSQIFSNVGLRGRNALMADSELDQMIESEAND